MFESVGVAVQDAAAAAVVLAAARRAGVGVEVDLSAGTQPGSVATGCRGS